MIKLTTVTKKFGQTTAINNINLDIKENGIYCLIGRNGAGKSTLMSLIAGYSGATAGEVVIDGKRVSPSRRPEIVNCIGVSAPPDLSEGQIARIAVEVSNHFNMKVGDLISTAAKLQDNFDYDFALETAERFELDLNKKYNHLSFGMKVMLTTIMALANNSKIIMLDEPTLGFDAVMRGKFNEMLLESYAANPRIIIVSTHLIDEMAKVAERFIIIEKGRIIAEAATEEIDEKAYTLTGASDLVLPLIQQNNLNCISKTTAGNITAAHIYDRRITPPEGISVSRMGLQDFFINLIND